MFPSIHCRPILRASVVAAGLCSLAANALLPTALRAELFLPGTQPKERDFHFRDVANCYLCHSRTTNGPADPYFSWQGGIMAQAARDPVFRAALAIANQDISGVGEFCIRCHSPRGWFEGRSTPSDASLIQGDDLHGVSCDVCHHLVDPLSAEAKKLTKYPPPGYGNGMMVLDTARPYRGPYPDPKGLAMHPVLQSPYHATSELCGNCHNVSNPTAASNVTNQPPYAFGHIERTYSEWALSDFAKKETLQSCQSCHFPRVPGGGRAVNYVSTYADSQRDYFVSHDGVGGSTWVQDAIYKIWGSFDPKELNREALEASKAKARKLLKTAAVMGLEITNGKAHLTITNLTGHKLPTGYPEGRRLWVNIRFFNGKSNLVQELGRYGPKAFPGNRTLPTVLDPESTRVYECLPGISPAQAAKFQTQAGPSFHFILNDVITKDNRIPPRGYKKAAFAEHLSAPIGADYADGRYWDDLSFALPAGTEYVEARLMYQSASAEYIYFLFNRNTTDDWGKKLFDAWQTTGQCPPEEIAFARASGPPK